MAGKPVRTGGGRLRLAAAAGAAVLAAGGAATLGVALSEYSPPPPRPPAAVTTAPAHPQAPESTGPTPAAPAARPDAARPVAVGIPAIGVHSDLLSLGLNPDGTVEVPSQPMKAGWYRDSAVPGQPGAAVILGHVDSRQTGPAVFYRLGSLRPGDTVSVTLADGHVLGFTVDTIREYPKDAFPVLAVYGSEDASAHLRLVTCGDWDARAHTYRDNLVVSATLTARTR